MLTAVSLHTSASSLNKADKVSLSKRAHLNQDALFSYEPWILDFSGDLYDKEITLEFYRFLRPEVKFPNLDALKDEIHHNARQTREYFEQNEIQF